MDRPLLNRVWAEEGQVTPYEDEKYLQGFVAEVPTYEGLNYLQQKLDLTLKSLAERGVLEWGEDVRYEKGALAWDTDGVIYVCLVDFPNTSLNPKDNTTQWSISVIQLSKSDFQALANQIDNHIADMNNPHNVTPEQLNIYRRNAVDNLVFNLNKNINDHKADKANPHKVTAAQAGAVSVTGGAYTGTVTFQADETVLNTAVGNQAITSKADLIGFRKDNVRVGLTPDKRLVRKDGAVITDVYMSEEEYLTKRQEIEHLYSSPSPDFQMDLSSDISIKRGVGIAEFSRPSTRVYLNKSGVSSTAKIDEPCWTIDGLNLLKNTGESLVIPSKGNLTGFNTFTMYLEFVPTEACELYSDNSPVTDKIYTNANGYLLVDLHTPSNIKRTFNAGKVVLGEVNRFSLSVEGTSLTLMLNGVSTDEISLFTPNKTYTEMYVGKNSSVSLRQFKIWSLALTTKQLSKL